MAKLRSRAFLHRHRRDEHGDHLEFRLPPGSRRSVGSFMRWVDREAISREGEDVELDLTVDRLSIGRTLDQNALMWALYEVEADVENGGMLGPGATTKDELYDRDMLEHAPVVTVTVDAEQADHVKRLAKIKAVRFVGDGGRLELDVMITTSKWDTVRMARHVDMQFNRLAYAGIPMGQAEDVKHYWKEWRHLLNKHEIILHDEPMTEEEYRERQPNCEACGTYVGGGRGLLCHISTRGSGVTWGPEKKKPENWLHLCPGCELFRADSIHRGGWSKFLQTASHLRFKVMRALKRETMEVEVDG